MSSTAGSILSCARPPTYVAEASASEVPAAVSEVEPATKEAKLETIEAGFARLTALVQWEPTFGKIVSDAPAECIRGGSVRIGVENKKVGLSVSGDSARDTFLSGPNLSHFLSSLEPQEVTAVVRLVRAARANLGQACETYAR